VWAFAPDYHRIDATNFAFKISPTNNAVDHIIFVNVHSIAWPPIPTCCEWGSIRGFALCDEVDSEELICVVPFDTSDIAQLKTINGKGGNGHGQQ
jgi:hypothetical protein